MSVLEGTRWQRPVFLAVSALAVVTVAVAARDVMLPLVLGLVIAYVLTPLVDRVERRRVPRGLAILIVYVVVLGSLAGFVRLVAPRVAHEVAKLAHDLPALTRHVREEWIPPLQEKLRVVTSPAERDDDDTTPAPNGPNGPHDATGPDEEQPALVVRPRPDGSFGVEVGSGMRVRHQRDGSYVVASGNEQDAPFDADRFVAESVQQSLTYARQNAIELVRIGSGIVFGVSRVIFVFGITLMIAAYLMLTRERILGFFRSLVRPSTRDSFDRLVARMDRGLAGVVRGQIVICLINGALSAIGFAIVGLKYWPLMAIVATVFSLVPIFGSIVSSIPAVALGLTQSPGTAFFVLIWIIGIHQLEANVLNPKIMGDAAKIHPVLVIVSLLVGEHFFHAVGALLAVPVMSIAQSVFIHFRQIVQRTDPELADEPVASIPPPR